MRRETFIDGAKDEYMRVFIGPAALPASPTNLLTGIYDMSLLQENTLAVRAGIQKQRLRAEEDRCDT